MPDDLERIDDIEGRDAAFTEQMGIPEPDYSQILEESVAHAMLTPIVATDPSWRFIGPRNVGGRVTALAQNPVNPLIIYAGSAHGGLWRSIDSGDTWERLGDRDHVFPVGAIALHPDAPSILYVGTGSLHESRVSGRGLYRVTITGEIGKAAFELLSGKPLSGGPVVGIDPPTTLPVLASPGSSYRYTRIRVDPYEKTRFWAASQTGLWRCDIPPGPRSGARFLRDFPDINNEPVVAKLEDTLLFSTWPSHCTDVLVACDPRESVTCARDDGHEVPRYLVLYVAVYGVGIFRGRFDRKNKTTTFQQTPLDLPLEKLPIPEPPKPPKRPTPLLKRIRLALCERHPEHVFAVVERGKDSQPSEVFRSSNNGDNWTSGANRPHTGGQAWYDLVLEVAPDNPSVVVCGEVDLSLSRDSGDTWNPILLRQNYNAGDKAQHADQHVAMFDAGDRRKLWVGNDGGLSLARNLDLPPGAEGYWRKRSHGIYAGQFQDITTCPIRPFLFGGGLQDNGTYLSLGGATWMHVDGGDGGMMAIDLEKPHMLYATWQGNFDFKQSGIDLTTPILADGPIGPFDYVGVAAKDLPDSVAPGHRIKYQSTEIGKPDQIPPINASLFTGILEQHPRATGTLIVGRVGNAFGSPDRGKTWKALNGVNLSPPVVGASGPEGEGVTAVRFGPPDPTSTITKVTGWLGTSAGRLFHTDDAPFGMWNPVAVSPWGSLAPQPISRIAVHPLDPQIVAVSSRGERGRVFLSYDAGARWFDITEPHLPATTGDLPPCPMSSVLFDPGPVAGAPMRLFAGTLAGVYVLAGIPVSPPPPTAAGLGTPLAWRPFNNNLPLVLVNDMEQVADTTRIRIATFGLGCFECDTGPQVAHRLFIRQTVIEDGRAEARPFPLPMSDDPRLPAGRIALDHTHAFDIRIDAPPYTFFDDVVDGVEFDEQLEVNEPIPFEDNYVYVQVHNSGTITLTNGILHLYATECDPIPALAPPLPGEKGVASAIPATLDKAAPLSDFYTQPGRNPLAASKWKRIGSALKLDAVRPDAPIVARFTWSPDDTFSDKHAALLALCEGPDTGTPDVLPVAPIGDGTIKAFIEAERRAALRIVKVAPRPPARLFVRDGISDDTRTGGYPVGGRSPDIMVRHPGITNPADEFADLLAQHPNDTIQGSVDNVVYVRVHNDSRFEVNAQVTLFAIKLDAANRPDTALANWIQLPTSFPVDVAVPARSVAYAKIEWPAPIDTPVEFSLTSYYLLVALIAEDAGPSTDRLPNRNLVTDVDSMWSLITRFVDSDNAAARAVRWIA